MSKKNPFTGLSKKALETLSATIIDIYDGCILEGGSSATVKCVGDDPLRCEAVRCEVIDFLRIKKVVEREISHPCIDTSDISVVVNMGALKKCVKQINAANGRSYPLERGARFRAKAKLPEGHDKQPGYEVDLNEEGEVTVNQFVLSKPRG